MSTRKAQQKRTSNTTSTETNTTQESTKKMALTPDQINQLLSDQRGRGDYGVFLTDFVASKSSGEEVNLETGILAGKTAEKAKVGINNAIKSRDKNGALRYPDAQNVVVVSPKGSDSVFVINKDFVGGATDEEA